MGKYLLRLQALSPPALGWSHASKFSSKFAFGTSVDPFAFRRVTDGSNRHHLSSAKISIPKL